MAGESVPRTRATVLAYTVTSTRHETTESPTKPVALPSGVLISMNRHAGSLAIVRFFVISATTSVLTAPVYASDCTTAGRFFPRSQKRAGSAPRSHRPDSWLLRGIVILVKVFPADLLARLPG